MTKQEIIERIRAIKASAAEAADLRDELAEKRTELAQRMQELAGMTELRDRLQAIADMTYWAELESGKSIAVGDRVRYFGKTYTCTAAHTKTLLRSPLNGEYWEEEA